MVYNKRDMITRVKEVELDFLSVRTTFLSCYFVALRNPKILVDPDFCLRFQEIKEITDRLYVSLREFKILIHSMKDEEFLEKEADLEDEISYLEEIYHLVSDATILFQDYIELLTFSPEQYWQRILARNGEEYEDYLNCIEGNFEMIKTLKEKEDYFE